MTVEIKSGTQAPPCKPGDFVRIEKYVGVPRPKAFKRDLLRANGGKPVRQRLAASERERMVDRLLFVVTGLDEGPFGDFDMEIVSTQIEARLGDC